ncbi:MAG: hypothetical protein WCJ37_12780 [Syntrophus sp. (in: bacteria)]
MGDTLGATYYLGVTSIIGQDVTPCAAPASDPVSGLVPSIVRHPDRRS